MGLPKRGNSREECEDASDAVPAAGRFAMADGATQSGFAADWARVLVAQFVAAPAGQPWRWSDWLPAARQRWSEKVGRRADSSYYAEAKFREGAHATFLGLTVDACGPGRYRWQAVAVGDCCLFHTRGGELLGAFPLEQPASFNNSPRLVGSRTSADLLEEKTLRREHDALPGDQLGMMTDALAAWFLQEREDGGMPWSSLAAFLDEPASDDRFASWIDQQRDARRLHDDDVTLFRLNLA